MKAVAARAAVVLAVTMGAAGLTALPAVAGEIHSCQVTNRDDGTQQEPGWANVKCTGINARFQAVIECRDPYTGNWQTFWGPWVSTNQISAAGCPVSTWRLMGVGWNTWTG